MGQLVVTVTDRDLRIAVGQVETKTVEQVMSRDVITVTSTTSIVYASRLLAERKIGAVPVTEDGRLIGIISPADLLKAFTELH